MVVGTFVTPQLQWKSASIALTFELFIIQWFYFTTSNSHANHELIPYIVQCAPCALLLQQEWKSLDVNNDFIISVNAGEQKD